MQEENYAKKRKISDEYSWISNTSKQTNQKIFQLNLQDFENQVWNPPIHPNKMLRMNQAIIATWHDIVLV